MSPEQLKADFPETYKAIQDAAVAQERDRFDQLHAACGNDVTLLAECFANGTNILDAQRLRVEKLQAENQGLTEQVFLQGNPTDDQIRAYFAATPSLHDEFANVQSYLACVHDDRKHLI